MVLHTAARRLIAAATLALALAVAAPAGAEIRDPFTANGLGNATNSLLAAAAAPPPGFTESVAFSGLTEPTAVRFAPDGRVIVAEKGGKIKIFDSLSDPTPTTFADLSNAVHNFWDRGLLGIALDPNFTSNGTIYVLYAYDKAPNSPTVPRWGDTCPTPPGATGDGCVIGGRLSRISSTGAETVLIEDWCQQYPSHSIGSLAFGADGALYVSAGDGASFNFADYGQDGSPLNPCGDPPTGVGGTQTPPTAQGGALRAQDIRTTGDPTGLDGAILRLNPLTGEAMGDNPNAGSSDPNTRRIVANGLRNPFRITVRPGTNEVWAGDVGWNTWEEIDRIVDPKASTTNFGWPCYEGNDRQDDYDNLNLSVCENLYNPGDTNVTDPYYTYNHSAHVVNGESCPTGGSSISGLAFYTGGSFGPAYDGALFFADYSRNCIWVMMRGANGLPDPSTRAVFNAGAAGPVDLQVGPGGDLYYVDMNGGTIRRIRGSDTGHAPTAVAAANPTTGAVPLTVNFDGRGSSDPDGDTLTYAWDLDGDGQFDDSTSATPSRVYTTPATVTVGLRVADPAGHTDTDTINVSAGTPPSVSIDSPAAGTTWKVGDTISFTGSGTDSAGQALPPSSLTWQINLQHCNRESTSCHTHVVQSLTGAGGSFVAPDHEYPSYLELQLTGRDAAGLTRTVTRRLDPRTVALTLASDPPGANLTLSTDSATAPFTRDVILGSANTITAPTPVTLGGLLYDFAGWSDGGARTHVVTANANATYTATYSRATSAKLAGADVIGDNVSRAFPGGAEVYRTVADVSGSATALRVHLDSTSNASAMVIGLYADSGGQPTTLLASQRLNGPVAGAWNEVAINGPNLTAGTAYWISVLIPNNATGVLRWHDRAGTTGGAEQTSSSDNLAELPTTWATGGRYTDGPISGYVVGTPSGGGGGSPALGVTPSSLAFSATAGGANPAAKSLSVSNTGSGTLSFTVSDDATWLTVSPTSGTAPATLNATANITGLASGTYTAVVTVTAPGATGSPKQIPVTLTVDPAPPPTPVLSVTPTSLSFSATVGAANPANKTLAVANTGGGTLSFTQSDNASWLTVTPASGSAPATLTAAVNTTGLAAGTYNGAVTVTASGASGSPATIPVTLTVSPSTPTNGLVGAWAFDEATGTSANDTSGSGNNGTVSGALRGAGHSGGGLTFDGVNDWVSVPDAASLDLTTAMTLEAWVRPTALGNAWRTVVIKEQPSQLAYALYAGAGTNAGQRPSANVFTNTDHGLLGSTALPLNTWTHLAMTWGGGTQRIYVNGTQVATAALGGTAVTSASPLRIGGNGVWGEWFQGSMDDVRVYNRALTATEIAADRDAPVGTAAVAARSLRSFSGWRAPNTRQARRAARRTRHAMHCGTHWAKAHGGTRKAVKRMKASCRRAHRKNTGRRSGH